MSRRTERLGSTIRQEVAQIIMRELADPRLDGTLPSITRVKVAEDLATADIFVVLMGTPGKQSAALAALRHAAGMMRTRLSKSLTIRQVPYLRFQIDEAYYKEMEVLDLIRKAEREREEREGVGPGAGEGSEHGEVAEDEDRPPHESPAPADEDNFQS